MVVSIIIPVYNVAPYIIRCLQSVASQTINDLECILVDDCGKDSSIELAQEFITNYHGNIKFSIVHHKHNYGLAAARNTGIRCSSGDFLYFLDSDDAIVPDCIETLILLFQQHPDTSFVQGNYLDEENHLGPYAFHKDIPQYIDEKKILDDLILCQIVTSSCNRLLPKKFIIENNLFFPEGILHEDLYWVYYLAKYAKAAAFTHKGLYIYYKNEGSIVTSTTNETRINRYTSRIFGAKSYFEDMFQNGSTISQRQFFAVNLTSCLVELGAVNSFTHWSKFWLFVISVSLKCVKKTTWNRFLFLCCLMPPICFFAQRKNVRWKIQNDLLARI